MLPNPGCRDGERAGVFALGACGRACHRERERHVNRRAVRLHDSRANRSICDRHTGVREGRGDRDGVADRVLVTIESGSESSSTAARVRRRQCGDDKRSAFCRGAIGADRFERPGARRRRLHVSTRI